MAAVDFVTPVDPVHVCGTCAAGLGLVELPEDHVYSAWEAIVEGDTAIKCAHCLGLLQDVETVADEIESRMGNTARQFDASGFAVEIVLPRAISLRHKQFVEYVEKRTLSYCHEKDGHYSSCAPAARFELRKVFASRLIKLLEVSTAKQYNIDGPLTYHIELKHECDAEVVKDRPSGGQGRWQGGGGRAPKKQRTESSSAEVDAFPPPRTSARATVRATSVRRLPIYVGGRYLKLARHISQTPWIIEGKLKTEHSVADAASVPTADLLMGDECGFVAAGREDADVRMLGTGRPFFLEVKNARKAESVNSCAIAERINEKYTGLVQVSRLCQVSSTDIKLVKEGEELKAKRYTCLVWAKDLDPTKIAEVNDMKELKIDQRTPTRVLHRRPNLSRSKTIHWMKLTPIDDNFVKMELETQAGTYIKEFVTGDMGRTLPNLGTLLDTVTDILELDDWPPAQSLALEDTNPDAKEESNGNEHLSAIETDDVAQQP